MRYNSNVGPIITPDTGKKAGGSCKRKGMQITSENGTKAVVDCHGTWTGSRKTGWRCVPCDDLGGAKTRGEGGNQAYSRFVGGRQRLIPTDRGGRGQTLWFNQAGTPQTVDAGMSVSQYVMGLVGVGVLFFVIGYGYKKGVEKA